MTEWFCLVHDKTRLSLDSHFTVIMIIFGEAIELVFLLGKSVLFDVYCIFVC